MRGKKAKTKSGKTKQKAVKLIHRPHFPRDQRRGGREAPKSRRQMRVPIVTRYDLKMATAPRELIDRKAVVDPMLMSERSRTTRNETNTARRGMFQPGRTCKTLSASVTRAASLFYLFKPSGRGEAFISSKRPKLTTCCSNFTEAARDQEDDDDSDHHGRSSLASSGVIEYLHKRLSRPSLQHFFNVTRAKGKSRNHQDAEASIWCNRPHDCFR